MGNRIDSEMILVIKGWHNYKSSDLALKEFIQENYTKDHDYSKPEICMILGRLIEKLNLHRAAIQNMLEYERTYGFFNRVDGKETYPMGFYDILYHGYLVSITLLSVDDLKEFDIELPVIFFFMTSDEDKKVEVR